MSHRDDERAAVSRRQVLVLSSAAVASTILPIPALALPEAIEEYEPLPWMPGRTGFLRSGRVSWCHNLYWHAAKAYRETGDASDLRHARYSCLHFIGGALSYPPRTVEDVRHQRLGWDLFAKALREYPEVPWEEWHMTHYGLQNFRSWPRREWFKENRESRLVLLAEGYAD